MKTQNGRKRPYYATRVTYMLAGILISIWGSLLSGCGAQRSGQQAFSVVLLTDRNTGAAFSEIRDMQESDTAAQRIERLLTRAGTWTPPVELTQLDTAIAVQGTVLTYGQLEIQLPEEVTVEEIASKGEGRIVDLINAEQIRDNGEYMENGAVPPRIWLAHYRAVYETQEQTAYRRELVNALLELLPKTPLYLRLYEEPVTGDCHLLLTYTREGKNGYILVCEKDVYFAEEVAAESLYSFGGLLDDGAVQWADRHGETGDRDSRRYNMVFRRLCPEEGASFLITYYNDNDSEVQEFELFWEGCFQQPYQELRSAVTKGRIEFEDYNFDGCADIILAEGEEIFLWDYVDKVYHQAQVPEEFLTNYVVLFPETKTIWSAGWEFTGEDSDWNYVDEIETLWQWEGSSLVRRRESREARRGDAMQLTIYDDALARELQNQTFTREEWGQKEAERQMLYECFYEGLAPTETYERRHYVESGEQPASSVQYIPQGLIDKITNAILTGRELETLKAIVSDRELTEEEVIALARENMDLRNALNSMESVGYYVMVMTDGDNDGIEDIIAEEYYGGTGGFTEYVFYKGAADGTYQCTDSFSSVKEEFAFISYEGKNYLCRTCYDYTKKIYNGISLACYIDGELVEIADLTLIAEDYNIRLAECGGEKYRPLAERMVGNCRSYKEAIDEYENIKGSAEEEISEEEWDYRCDLNNDGVLEKYEKSIWLPSNMSTREFLTFGCDQAHDMIWEVILSGNDRPIMLWADDYEGETVMHVIYLNGLEDFEIIGYVIQGEEYQSIYRITADAQYGVETIRTTENFPNNGG